MKYIGRRLLSLHRISGIWGVAAPWSKARLLHHVTYCGIPTRQLPDLIRRSATSQYGFRKYCRIFKAPPSSTSRRSRSLIGGENLVFHMETRNTHRTEPLKTPHTKANEEATVVSPARAPTCDIPWPMPTRNTKTLVPAQTIVAFRLLTFRSRLVRLSFLTLEAYRKLQDVLRQITLKSTLLESYNSSLFFCAMRRTTGWIKYKGSGQGGRRLSI
ncbi:hypothetical protein LZ31DRAFT_30172 [Colletotrichum somersetense]|nr:hypothetical protein LZ31DRAFT_30172 [Colletotrichum somersetense]